MSKNRLIRLVALAGCSVLIGAFGYTPAATAHIGNSHAPGTTDGPDARTATIVSGETARVCFDEEVEDPVLDTGGFEARGYDSNIGANSTDADVDITNTSCVLVDTDHPNLDQATIMVIEEDTVDDPAGNQNATTAVTLTGSTFNTREAPRPGNSDAPEHISTTPVPQDDDIDYGFDEELDEDGDEDLLDDGCDATAFGYHEQAGTIILGDDCTTDGSTVTVSFSEDIQSGNVIRPFVKTDAQDGGACPQVDPPDTPAFDEAVRDLGTDERADEDDEESKYNTQSGGTGDNTNDVDLLTIARQGNNQLVFTFDSDSSLTGTPDPDCFFAHSEDGSIYIADEATRSGQVVTATFDNVSQAFQQIILGAVAPGGVTAVAGDINTYGSSPLSASGTESASAIPATQAPSYTDGPDLEQAVTNDANNTINYCHDEPLDPDVDDADSGDFFFTTTDSESDQGGMSILSLNGACALVQFSGANDVSTAAIAGEYDNAVAVRDRLGECDNDNESDSQGFYEDCKDRDEDGNNRNASGVSLAVGGPPPTTPPGPPAPPAPPGPPGAPPGQPTVRTGLCDPNRATAPLAELLIGDNGPNLICGFGGDDTLRGLNGADTLKGQKDDDVHAGGKGKDNARGGPGSDTLRGGRGADTLKGGGGRDTARGGKGTDLCRAEVEKGCEK